MANIKLTDHNWHASGIYDTNQNKSQATINSDVATKMGSAQLETTSQNLSGGVNELKGRADTAEADVSALKGAITSVEENIQNSLFLRDVHSLTTYTFPKAKKTQGEGNSQAFLLYGATSNTRPFLYLGFVSGSSSGSLVSFFQVYAGQDFPLTFTGSYSENTGLTITADGTVWGGINILWLQ